MGQATPDVFEAMGVTVLRAERAEDVRGTVDAAIKMAFDSNRQVAVLISQKIIGTKDFRAEERVL